MSKSILKVILLCVICATANTVYCQTGIYSSKLVVDAITNQRKSYQSKTPKPEKGRLKTIKYNNTNYSAIGYVYKDQFIEDFQLTFFDNNTRDTIISGKFYIVDKTVYIDGVWKQNTKNGMTYAVGIFKITNSVGAYQLTTNPKEGKPLQIEVIDIYYYKGFHNNYPAVLEKQNEENYSLTVNYYDMAGNIRILIVNRELIEKYGWFAIDDFIYFTNNIKIKYSNGDVFTGFTENTRTDDNMIHYKFREGVWTYAEGDFYKRELIKLPDGNYKFNVVYSEHKKDNNYAQMEMIVNKSFVDKYGYWGEVDFMLNIPDVKYTYKNGNIFTGKQVSTTNNINENSTSINSKLTQGKLQYATGEVFEGDLSGEWYRGVPIYGTMTFNDGSVEKGNWLIKYDVTEINLSRAETMTEKTQKIKLVKKYDFTEINLSNAETLTDIHKLAIRLYEDKLQKQQKQQEEEIAKQQEEEKKQIKEQKDEEAIQKLKANSIHKFGVYYGTLLFENKFILGMTKEMIKSQGDLPDLYDITINENIEIWVYSLDKILAAALAKGNSLAFQSLKKLLNEFGYAGTEALVREKYTHLPHQFIFTNNKVTSISY